MTRVLAVILVLATALTLVILPAGTTAGDNFDAINWYNKGVELAETGNYQEALTATEKSLDIQPNFSLAWTSKSGILVMLGRYSEALQSSERAITLRPDDVYAYCNRADALIGLGRYDEAVQAAEKVLTISPGLPEAVDLRARAMSLNTGPVLQDTVKPTPFGILPPILGACMAAGLYFVVRKRR
jgi:tetratricopeptide (TPR) repeat protein